MILPSRILVFLAVLAALARVIGANWQLVDPAHRSQPGCVQVAPDRAAAKPGC
ncbi:MAG: hypothetical protein ACK4S2_06185 [Gemmobacter sp.]|uniref:hypothetical protein n=1 Tax=Gemmobacter sp. TaxID=1898957 RepID=UPI00391B2541